MRQGSTLLGGMFAIIALTASSVAFADPVQNSPSAKLPNDLTSGTAGQGVTCCNGTKAPLSAAQVSTLEGNMKSLLDPNQAGGQLTATIRDLMLSDSNALSLILGLLPTASADQKSAIAAGLGQAARLWNGSSQGQTAQGLTIGPGVGLDIQVASGLTNDPAFILAYSTAAGNVPIGATGGGGGSSGGPGGQTGALGGGGFGTGNVEGINGNGVNTGGFSMTGGVVGGTSTSP